MGSFAEGSDAYRQLLIDAGRKITSIDKETRNGFTKMDASLGKLDGLERQVVGNSKSNRRKMDGLETQLRRGIEHFESDFNGKDLRALPIED
jgi:hypothetical protein